VVQLGKLIFFDPILSNNNKRSCASCHKPHKAFTDGADKSIAMDFEGKVLRNSPSLINSIYSDRYFWDLRVDKLEDQIEHVVVSEKEFHTDYFNIFDKMLTSKEYVELFKASFPETKQNPVNSYTLSTSLAAYVSSLTALNSRFDRYVRGETIAIEPDVIKGFNLFMGKAGCGTCHFAPTFNGSTPPFYTESESEVLGVPRSKDKNSPLDDDAGRSSGKVRENSNIYLHSFKTPTIRNVALTAPYMHNGVYNTLEELMEFYNNGGGAGLGLSVPNQTLPSDSLGLTATEIKDIVSFMKSLTDTTGTTSVPSRLPSFDDAKLSARKIGGEY
ncbi:MAG TPA: cytochrome c peroxidase, partial [Cytophagaceae bacterium]